MEYVKYLTRLLRSKCKRVERKPDRQQFQMQPHQDNLFVRTNYALCTLTLGIYPTGCKNTYY
jgi:hypothetical protein